MGLVKAEREGRKPETVGLIVWLGRWGAWDAMVGRYGMFQRLAEWHAGGPAAGNRVTQNIPSNKI